MTRARAAAKQRDIQTWPKKTPETDFGAKKCCRNKLEFSRLNPDFKKKVGSAG